ncbi:MAG: hypothetical protein HYZ25_19895 [Chloroflexi bacterium]|nr:hypothetical protein [Chloroflexota bacterium]
MNHTSGRRGIQILAGLIIFITLTACQANTHSIDNAASTAQSKSSPATHTLEILSHGDISIPKISADGRHMWILSIEQPVDELRKHLGQGHERILSVAYGDGYWVSTLLRDNREIQYIDALSALTENDLNNLIDRGYFINSVAQGDKIWLVTYSTTNESDTQKIIISTNLSIEDLASDQKDGYFVTSLTFGEGKWVIILTKDRDITDQKVSTMEEDTELETVLNENGEQYFVSAIAGGNDKIVVVKSLFRSFTQQEIVIDDSFQKDFIQDAWFNRYDNVRVFFVNGQWVHVVMK